jgi:hypothetical protein
MAESGTFEATRSARWGLRLSIFTGPDSTILRPTQRRIRDVRTKTAHGSVQAILRNRVIRRP